MMYLNNTFLLLFTLFSVLVFFYFLHIYIVARVFQIFRLYVFHSFFYEVKDAFYLVAIHLQISTTKSKCTKAGHENP